MSLQNSGTKYSSQWSTNLQQIASKKTLHFKTKLRQFLFPFLQTSVCLQTAADKQKYIQYKVGNPKECILHDSSVFILKKKLCGLFACDLASYSICCYGNQIL